MQRPQVNRTLSARSCSGKGDDGFLPGESNGFFANFRISHITTYNIIELPFHLKRTDGFPLERCGRGSVNFADGGRVPLK